MTLIDRRAAALLGALAVIAWLILPTAPNYDTATHLVWSHEILAGRAPGVDAASAPTLHPLWLVATLIASATGAGASALQLISLLSLAVVVACAYRLAADVAGVVAGVLAAVASGSSFALLLLAFKAYVDLPFLAVVLTAVVVERGWRPRAGDLPPAAGASEPALADVAVGGAAATPASRRADLAMPALMLVAGLLRPEAWAIGLLLVGLRLVRGGVLRDLVMPGAIVLAAPVLWALADLVLTGDPLHSLTGTQALAEELGRKTGLGNAPRELLVQLSDLARPPIAAGGVLGVALALRLVGWRPLLIPLATLAASVAGFLLIGALGLPLLQRYLQLPAVLLCVFAGIAAAVVVAAARGEQAIGGPISGEPTRGGQRTSGPGPVPLPDGANRPLATPPAVRALAIAALVVGVLGAGGYLVLKAGSFRIVAQGVLREARWQREGAALLSDPRVADLSAQGCGPISLPTYRFVPELTLAAGLDEGAIVSRAQALGGAGPQPSGIALTVDGPKSALRRLGWAAGVPRTTNAIPPGFTPVASRGPFVASANCADAAPAAARP